ncbi:MAG TPA: caspase family protein [Stellaceae bacterium]|nr:caspase family protein [Stellaceae bacterium]
MRQAFWAIAAAAMLGGPAIAADAPDSSRIALVIGNSAYRNVPALTNPANDARGVAATLKGLGFTLVGDGAETDLDKPALEKAIRSFGEALKSGGVGLFYYAGHGLQVHGENYLVPVDANPTKEADIDFELVDANLVLRQMEEANAKLNIVILDACRNNPFGGTGTRAIASGLAQMKAPEGTIISYATQPGNVASDGGGEHSPFATAIMSTLGMPNLDVLAAFNQIGVKVKKDTGDSQQPWVANSPIDGEFYFATGPAAASPGQAVTAAAPAADDPEIVFWKSIAKSTNPADYQAYLDTYPNGKFASLAKVRANPATATQAMAARQITTTPATTTSGVPVQTAAATPPAHPTPAPTTTAPTTTAPTTSTTPPPTTASTPKTSDAKEMRDYGVAPTTQISATDHGATPTSIPSGKVILTEALVDLRAHGMPVVVDAIPSVLEHQTIQGAVWMPFAGLAATTPDEATTRLGQVLDHMTKKDHTKPLVFFCSRVTCWAGYNAALRAIQLGYRNVYWYRGGLAAWNEAGQPMGKPVLTIREHPVAR